MRVRPSWWDSIAPNAIAVTSGARGEVPTPGTRTADSYGTVTAQRVRCVLVVLYGLIWTRFQLDIAQETKKFCPNPYDGLNDREESVLDSCGR